MNKTPEEPVNLLISVSVEVDVLTFTFSWAPKGPSAQRVTSYFSYFGVRVGPFLNVTVATPAIVSWDQAKATVSPAAVCVGRVTFIYSIKPNIKNP